MRSSWQSSEWGARLTFSKPWRARLKANKLFIEVGARSIDANLLSLHVSVSPGLMWANVELFIGAERVLLGGCPNDDISDFPAAVGAARDEAIKDQIATLDVDLAPLVKWYSRARALLEHQHSELRRWITQEVIAAIIAQRPATAVSGMDFLGLVAITPIGEHLRAKRKDLHEAIEFWPNPRKAVEELNAQHLASESQAYKNFFDTVETKPLTDEQIQAVVCFDNRVQVVAAAGSGKTSTMVAKAAYAVHRKLVPPENILLLAFSKEAADELQQRIIKRLTPLGLPADKITAKTFHAFGLEVIGQATGKKPTLARWLDNNGDIAFLSGIVTELKKGNAAFRAKWDLFRLVLGRDLPAFGNEENDPEDWDKKGTGFRTLQGDVVKSQAERLIADWLFFNGVRYEYERPYEVDTPHPEHGRYHPDFYYPDIKLYHEHFALDGDGLPPDKFPNYLQGVIWKRSIHQTKATHFIETTMAQLWSGELFKVLEQELTSRGVVLKPDPDRKVEGVRKVIEQPALVKLFRSFLTHVKSNRLPNAELRARVAEETDKFRYRREVFLDLFEAIRSEWERQLQTQDVIDFEDMLSMAADHLEAKKWDAPYRLVMVDEFQDTSNARARLVKALVDKPLRHLFVVGDDWQGIYRFAGAEISTMTSFNDRFGPGPILRLQKTFRCPQSLCDVSTSFVLANPEQIKKEVVSAATEVKNSIRIIQVQSEEEITETIKKHLTTLPAKSSVFILGRYRRDAEYAPDDYPASLDLEFLTVHGSKGLEADYVVLPRVVRGFYGFPSGIEDDPILRLAMTKPENFEHAEERRLFYVALTRARRGVVLVTVENWLSEFVLELKDKPGVSVESASGKPALIRSCPGPKCQGVGTLVPRQGRFGRFYGCSTYPQCDYTENLPRSQ